MIRMTLGEPVRTDFKDGGLADAFGKQIPLPAYLADVSPAPPELVDAVKARFLAKNPTYAANPHTEAGSDPLEQWAQGHAALSHQLNWWEEQNNSRIVKVADFYAPDASITSLFPAWVESQIQSGMIAEGIVPWLTFATENVNSQTVRAVYDSSAATTRSLKKIGPGGELPKVKLSFADSDVHLFKFGVALEAAYEITNQQSIDVLAYHLQRVGMQIAVDESDLAMHTLITGDGTTAGSAETNTTDVDVATSGTVLYSDLLSWVYDPDQPYRIDRAVGGKTDLALVANLSEFKKGAEGAVAAGLPDPRSLAYRRWDGGVTGSSYVDRLIVGVDSRMALKAYRMGSLLQETDRIITKQVNEWTASIWLGFRKFDAEATHVLDCAAVL